MTLSLTSGLFVSVMVVSGLIGWLKSKYVLDIAAHKYIVRTAENPYGHPISMVSVRWLVIISTMSGVGFALRTLPDHASIKTFLIGIIYPGVGSALIWSSLILLGFRDHRHPRFDMTSKAQFETSR
jgi:hypothetical protein